MGIKLHVERDRHFNCQPGKCLAPMPSARRLQGRAMAPCRPRRVYWLRVNRGGRRETFSFQSEGEAQVALQRIRAAAVLGQDYQPKGAPLPTVRTFATISDEALRLHAAIMSIRPATRDNYRKFLDGHLRPYFGKIPLTNITILEIQKFIAVTRARLSDSTIKSSLPTLRLVLDHAVKLRLLPANPMRSGERLWRPAASEPVEAFTASELRSILKAAQSIDRDFAALIAVMAQGGLRPGEALAVRRQDIDLTMGVVTVSGTQGRRGRGPTKNTYSMRKVSVLHPVTEDRPVWRPADAGIPTRHALDHVAVLVATAPDPETRIWPITAIIWPTNGGRSSRSLVSRTESRSPSGIHSLASCSHAAPTCWPSKRPAAGGRRRCCYRRTRTTWPSRMQPSLQPSLQVWTLPCVSVLPRYAWAPPLPDGRTPFIQEPIHPGGGYR